MSPLITRILLLRLLYIHPTDLLQCLVVTESTRVIILVVPVAATRRRLSRLIRLILISRVVLFKLCTLYVKCSFCFFLTSFLAIHLLLFSPSLLRCVNRSTSTNWFDDRENKLLRCSLAKRRPAHLVTKVTSFLTSSLLSSQFIFLPTCFI